MRTEKARYLLLLTYNTDFSLFLVEMEKISKGWTIGLLKRGVILKKYWYLASMLAPKENLCIWPLLKKTFMNTPSVSWRKACYMQKKNTMHTHIPRTKFLAHKRVKKNACLYQITHQPFKISNGPPVKERIYEKKRGHQPFKRVNCQRS